MTEDQQREADEFRELLRDLEALPRPLNPASLLALSKMVKPHIPTFKQIQAAAAGLPEEEARRILNSPEVRWPAMCIMELNKLLTGGLANLEAHIIVAELENPEAGGG